MKLHNSSYVIHGKRYRLEYRRLRGRKEGYCSAPDQPKKHILIHYTPRRRARSIVQCLLHEILHAAGWNLDDDWVERTSRDMARILDDQGLINAGGDDNERG